MKKTCDLLLAISVFANLFISTSIKAQAPSWQWAKRSGGISDDQAKSVSVDVSGNVYVTGEFYSSPFTIGSTTLTNLGTYDIFLAKYDSNGNVLWAKSAGGIYADEANGVFNDASGNAYITGYFDSPTIAFGSTTLTNTGGFDTFIAKYDTNGNFLWAKSAVGTGADYALSISGDGSGNVYVSGSFQSSPIAFGSTSLTNSGAFDIFIAKYDSNGNVLWAKSAGGASFDHAYGVSTNAAGNVCLVGYFQSPALTIGSMTLANADNTGSTRDVFIATYDASGNFLWAKSAGGTNDDEASSVSTDASGKVYMTGYFSSSSIAFGSTTLTSAGSARIFVAKLDANGNELWAKSAAGVGPAYPLGVCTDGSGNIYITGLFGSSLTAGTTTLTNAGGNNWDVFITKFDAIGNALWAKSGGGMGDDRAHGICTNAIGNVYITGYFASSSITFGSAILSNIGTGSDIFLAKLGNTIDTKITENNTSKKISAFPNPFIEQTTLHIEEPWENEMLTVVNCQGETVAQMNNINGNSVVFTRSNLPSGLYFARLTANNILVSTYKLVITDN